MAQPALRVAVVDDEDNVRKSLGRLLRSAGIAEETFASGRDLLDVARRRSFDCLVLDLHMPAMDGFEVHEELRRSGIRLPVVIITGHDKPEFRTRASAMGIAAYLPKPVDGEVLLSAIASAVAASSLDQIQP